MTFSNRDPWPIFNRRGLLKIAAGAAVVASVVLPLPAASQVDFPNRALTIIVPYPPGGSVDASARLIADRMQAGLGQPVIVQNKPGASTAIGLAALQAAPPNGYTLLYGASAMTTQAAVNRSFAQTLDSTIPLSEVARGYFLIAANTAVPASSVKELVDYSRQHPDALNYGSNGIGSSNHFTMEAFKSVTGAKMTHVPFSGSSPATAALLGNQIQIMCDPIYLLKPQLEQGKVKAIAVTGATRAQLLPNVATVAESGFRDFDMSFWFGLFLREGTPAPLVQKLNKAVVDAIRDPEVSKKLADMGLEPIGNSPSEFQARIRTELATWAKVVRDNNLKVE